MLSRLAASISSASAHLSSASARRAVLNNGSNNKNALNAFNLLPNNSIISSCNNSSSSSSMLIINNNSNRSRCFSAQASAAAKEAPPAAPRDPSLPPNLELADPSVFDKEITPPVHDPMRYLFPPLNGPAPLPVRSFLKPGETTGELITLDPRVFRVALRKDIIHNVIVHHRAKLRQPKKTKRKSEIRGSNKKPHPQKGTGRAQAGHRRNSIWKGGQKAHGPVIRDYSIGCNRKYRALAAMMMIASKEVEGNLIVVDNFELGSHKTKELFEIVKGHNLHESRCIFIDTFIPRSFALACGNLPKAQTASQLESHVYDMIRADKLIFTKSALIAMQSRLVAQYLHKGKRKAYDNSMRDYRDKVEKGRSIDVFDINKVEIFKETVGAVFDKENRKFKSLGEVVQAVTSSSQ